MRPLAQLNPRLAITLIAGMLAFTGITACTRDLPSQYFRMLSFGTVMELEVIGVDKKTAQQAYQALQRDFDLMHVAWHAWDPGPVGRINQFFEEGKSLVAPPSVLPLLRISQDLASRSDYLFDPGIGRLVDLWGFHRDDLSPHAPPEEEDIRALLEQKPSIADVRIEGLHLSSSNTAVKLDFGAIGKGYGVDRAIERLKSMGIKSAIVNAGGDLRAIGSRAGNPWRIAIRDPDGGGIFALISVTGDESVFTSGNYERNFSWNGRLYHHILDPRTGHPAEQSASVTVIHSDATTADAAATALFVAGPNDWHRIARQMGIKFVLLIDPEGNAYMNPAMHDRIKLQKSPKNLILSDPL